MKSTKSKTDTAEYAKVYNLSKANTPWTTFQDNTLRKMIKNGSNSVEIATVLGRTRAAIMLRKSALKISAPIRRAVGSAMPYHASSRKPVSKAKEKVETPEQTEPTVEVETKSEKKVKNEKKEKAGKKDKKRLKLIKKLDRKLDVIVDEANKQLYNIKKKINELLK